MLRKIIEYFRGLLDPISDADYPIDQPRESWND